MNNLHGLGSLRLLPFGGPTQNPVSAILSTYRSVRSRLIRKMSVAMIRRRSNLSFLEKRSIDGESNAATGCARLPIAMRRYPKTRTPNRGNNDPLMLPTSNVWASFHSQRSYTTMGERFERAKMLKRPKDRIDRPLVPMLVFQTEPKYQGNLAADRNEQVISGSKMLKLLRDAKKPVEGGKPDKSQKPLLPIMHIHDKTDQLVKARAVRSSRDMRPFIHPKRQRIPPVIRDRAQSLICMDPVLKFATADMPFLNTTDNPSRYLETYETRLRALRQSKPLKLKVPTASNSGNLHLRNRLVQRSLSQRSHRPTSFSPKQEFHGSPMQLPSIKPFKKSMPYNKRSTKLTRPKKIVEKPVENLVKQVRKIKHKERDNLNNLLGDLLDQNSSKQKVGAIEFHKISPLSKLVTTSMEGRSKLHTRAFENQLKTPTLYTSQTFRNHNMSTGASRRSTLLGHQAVVRARARQENKLSLLLNADTQYQSEDDGDDDDDDGDDGDDDKNDENKTDNDDIN